MILLDRYIDFLEKHKLTQAQFFMLYCLYKENYNVLKRYKKLFPADDGSLIGQYMLDDVIRKGFIEKIDGDDVTANGYKITDKFRKAFIDKKEAAIQFKDNYPPFMLKDGVRYPLSAIDEDEFIKLYNERAQFSVDEHIEIMKDLKYAVDNNLIQMNIKNFVGSKQWVHIRVLRENKTVNVGGKSVNRL